MAWAQRMAWPGAVECGHESFAVLDQASAVSEDIVARLDGGLDVEDRRQHAIGLGRARDRGEEILDLVQEAVDVPACGETKGVVAGLFEIARAGDVRREVASMARGRHAVVEPLYHQRRHVDGGQHRPHVDLPDHPDDPQERAGGYRHPLKAGE
jgi:hypothetical protein